MDMTQIESTRSNVEKLQYELGQTQDPGQRSELEGRLMDAQSQLVALSEQQYASTASEYSSSETAKEGEWVKTRSEATVSRDSSPGRIPSVFDAMGLNDKVSVRETYVQLRRQLGPSARAMHRSKPLASSKSPPPSKAALQAVFWCRWHQPLAPPTKTAPRAACGLA